jgi:hypothetical protein
MHHRKVRMRTGYLRVTSTSTNSLAREVPVTVAVTVTKPPAGVPGVKVTVVP